MCLIVASSDSGKRSFVFEVLENSRGVFKDPPPLHGLTVMVFRMINEGSVLEGLPSTENCYPNRNNESKMLKLDDL